MKKINSLGQLISSYRKSNNLTQEQLAKLIKKSRATVMRYEKNSVEIPYDVLKIIVTNLNIPAYELEAIKENHSVSTFRYMEHTNKYFENRDKYYEEFSISPYQTYSLDALIEEDSMVAFFIENYHHLATIETQNKKHVYLLIDYKYLYSSYETFRNNVIHLTWEDMECIYNETKAFFKFKLFNKIKIKD
ncbi:helix-turn-helix domain-containing protein [Streptobacillus moniliformis]|uniref:helix-turn-helix domain-containing protein n=1 Tax=Streptobacillus moniliformis TaxID=34105 RepID=UPI0007E30FD4|nr:helix-turn-helix transcriptional regulator [Streptobacillus moniliformis]